MNRITYLDRLGYVVTTDEAILVFDYYTDPSHALHRILEKNEDKPVVFFVTHYCREHFNKSIYELAQNQKRIYIMSNDVLPQNAPDTLSIAGMSKGDIIEDLPGIKSVRAYEAIGKSKGVSYLVTTKDGRTIFHDGALSDELEHPSDKPGKEADRFKSATDRLAQDYPAIDIAFLPVFESDCIASEHYARVFLETIKVKEFFPMIEGAHTKQACAIDDCVPSGTTLHYIHTPGESIEL